MGPLTTEVFERVVVGVDRSPAAEEGALWAAHLAGPGPGPVVAVHAAGLLAEPDGRPPAADREQARLERLVLDEWCEPFRRAGRAVRIVVRDGVPADVLRQVAMEEAADLVVVGTRGSGAAPAAALGSTSLHLLSLAPCPVLVVPAPGRSRWATRLQDIVLAVDDATSTSRAADLVARLAAAGGARVTIVHAVEEVPVLPPGPVTPAGVRPGLAPLVGRFRQGGLTGTLRIEDGPVHEVVPAIAASLDADLVVVGSAHPNHSPDPLHGSTSRQVAAVLGHLGIAVLVVPETTA